MIDDKTKEIISNFIKEKSSEIMKIHNSTRIEDELKEYAMNIIQSIIRELEINRKYIKIEIKHKEKDYDNFIFYEINKIMKNIGYKGSISYDNKGYVTLQFVCKYVNININ